MFFNCLFVCLFQAVFLITATASDDDLTSVASLLAADGVHVFVIGGGPRFNHKQLKQVS